jgi:hypothetical protein
MSGKKILVFGLPRSGTTIVQLIVCIRFQIPNLNEPFNNPALGFNPGNPKLVKGKPADLYKWTRQQSAGVMKLLGINLDYVDVERLLGVGNFDNIIIFERKNLADCCVSLCLAERNEKYIYFQGERVNTAPFECDTEFVDNWIKMYKKYLAGIETIKNSQVPYDVVCYEDFMNDQPQRIADFVLQKSHVTDTINQQIKMISTDLNYADLCVNYQQVQEKITNDLR